MATPNVTIGKGSKGEIREGGEVMSIFTIIFWRLFRNNRMGKFKVGDYVQWTVDVDKVYSSDTKTLVGKVGRILPPQEYYDAPFGNKYLTQKGFYDVLFPYGDKSFEVGQIPEADLVKVSR